MSVAEVLAGPTPYHVEHARAEHFLDSLPDACVSLAFLDLPYFGEKPDAWDNAWPDDGAFLAWVGGDICARVRRVLAPNGSLYVCASARLGSYVEMVVREHFEVLTNIRWKKPPHSTKAEMFTKEDLRAPFPASETIIFAEQRRERQGGTWRDALESARVAANMSRQDVSERIVGTRSGACWNWETGLRFPDATNWSALCALFPTLSRDARAEYESMRRPFFASESRPYTDVWDFATVNSYPGKHPCEKPEAMMEHVLEVSSRPGGVVLDCVSGSGAFPAKAVQLGRRVLAGDADAHWADVTRRRCEMARATGRTRIRRIEEAPVAQGRLF